MVVKHDRHLAADVRAGHLGELRRAARIEGERDHALPELILVRIGADHILAGHGRALLDDIVGHQRLLASPEFAGLHEFVTEGRHEALLLVGRHAGDQFEVLRVNHAEIQLRAHFDQVHQLDFFVLGHHRRPQRDIRIPRRSDFRLEDLLPLKPLAERLDRDIAVTVEVAPDIGLDILAAAVLPVIAALLELLQEPFVGNQLQDEFDTAVEVEPETDRTRSVLPDDAHHVAVVLQIIAPDHFGQVDALVVGRLQQRLRLIEVRVLGTQFFGVRHERIGLLLHLPRLFRRGRLHEQPEEGHVVIAFKQRMNRGSEHGHHHEGDECAQNQRSLVHSSPAVP